MISGKSIFSWNVPAVGWGDPENFIKILKDLGIGRVCFKVANGSIKHYISKNSHWPNWGENLKEELVEALRAEGIKIDFWHFLYGYDPQGELAVAIEQSQRFKPDGYIWDAESSFDSRSKAVENAEVITKGYRQAMPDTPQALCWWALPLSPYSGAQWHPLKVAKSFLKVVDVAMPMMYWQGGSASGAVSYFNKSIKIWRSFTDVPIIPIGRTYDGDGGYANSHSIEAFANVVDVSSSQYDLTGISWYSLDELVKMPTWMDAIRETPSFGSYLSLEEKVDRLVADHPGLFPELS